MSWEGGWLEFTRINGKGLVRFVDGSGVKVGLTAALSHGACQGLVEKANESSREQGSAPGGIFMSSCREDQSQGWNRKKRVSGAEEQSQRPWEENHLL